MDQTCLIGVEITPLKIIETPGGDIKHAIKATENSFMGFGEAYFSYVDRGVIKGWKRHREMTLNLVVPEGAIKFVIYDDREGSESYGEFQSIILSSDNYCRLTVPPMVWMAFTGVSDSRSMLLNVANIVHNPKESDHKECHEIEYNWEQ